VSKVYVLIRPKRGDDSSVRLSKLLKHNVKPLFLNYSNYCIDSAMFYPIVLQLGPSYLMSFTELLKVSITETLITDPEFCPHHLLNRPYNNSRTSSIV